MLAREKPHIAETTTEAAGAVIGPIGAEPAAAPPISNVANRKNMLLLVQFRWIAVVGQLITIAFVQYGLGIPLPLLPMIGVIVRADSAESRQLRVDALA